MDSLFPLIEPGMYFAIGFLLAALLSLPFMSAIHRRAVRLTRRSLDASLPISVDELRAEKDLLRSEFAVSTHRLQSALDEMHAKTTVQRAEIGRQGTTVATLKTELHAKARTIAALEARETALKDQLRGAEHEHALKSINLDDARRALASKEVELARFVATLDDRDVIADHQNFELVRTQVNVEALKVTVEDLNQEVDGLTAWLAQARDDSTRATHELAQERGKVEGLGRRVADLETELTARRSEAEALIEVTADHIGDQARIVAARQHENDRLRVALDGAHRAEAALCYEFAKAEERRHLESKAALSEKAALEVQIGQLKQEHQQLEDELQALQRHTEPCQTHERVEPSWMRTRIGEVAEQVAQLRSLLLTPVPDDVAGDLPHPANSNANGNGLNGHGHAGHPSFADLDVQARRDDKQASPGPVTN